MTAPKSPSTQPPASFPEPRWENSRKPMPLPWTVHHDEDVWIFDANGERILVNVFDVVTTTFLVDAINSRTHPPCEEKRAPVQGYAAGIPWSMHLRAYDAYCKKWGAQPAMIDLEGRNCRGGFGVSELDDFIPGWRDELSELTRLRTEVTRLRALCEELERAAV